MGCFFSQPPLAYWKKSTAGRTLVSRFAARKSPVAGEVVVLGAEFVVVTAGLQPAMAATAAITNRLSAGLLIEIESEREGRMSVIGTPPLHAASRLARTHPQFYTIPTLSCRVEKISKKRPDSFESGHRSINSMLFLSRRLTCPVACSGRQ